MIRIILGEEGTGKTKRIIDMANEAVSESKGSIIFIEGSAHHITDLKHEIRLVDASEFDISDYRAFYGFVCGMLAEDYDIDRIYVDGLFKIVDQKVEDTENFIESLKKLSDKHNIRFVASVTGDEEKLPGFLKDYLV